MARPHGTKYIETPEKMWELFEEYQKDTKGHPIRKMVFVGKDGVKDYEERERPLTMEGFENFVSKRIGLLSLDQYFTNQNEIYGDYVDICRAIKREIKQEHIRGKLQLMNQGQKFTNKWNR